MYCPNCGKELPENSRFCPSCGKECAPGQPGTPPPASTNPVSTVTLNTKALLIIAAAVIVVLLAVVIFQVLHSGQSAEQPGPTQGQEIQTPAPPPDPAEVLIGTWTNKDGVGLRFTSDGTLKLSGFGVTLGGDTFKYEVTGENTLTLTATVGGILSADIEAPYAVIGDTLMIELGGIELTLTRK